MDIEITHNLDPFLARMAGQRGALQNALVDGVNRTTLKGEQLAKQNIRANGSVVTGHMLRSTTAEPASAGGGGVTGKYGTKARSRTGFNYPLAVENGRGPVVARGRALRFQPKGGPVLFRKRVGPAPAKPFLKPTIPPVRAHFRTEMRAAIRRFLAGGGA